MPVDPRIQDALDRSNQFQALRALIKKLQTEGHDQAVIIALFEQAHGHLRKTRRENDEDVVTEVMDCLVGWCSPHVSLEPNKKIAK
jgi:hypothetical protein